VSVSYMHTFEKSPEFSSEMAPALCMALPSSPSIVLHPGLCCMP
jgi:hypothetical protein